METPPLPGATPLDPGEMEGLRLPHITSRQELDRWEQENIAEAEEWAFLKRRGEILSEAFLLVLHKRMFGKVWTWGGKYRNTEKNIGGPHWDVPVRVKNLCEDGKMWMKDSVYPEDEAATRIHHRLVSIHPFPNGNGRHARLVSDLLLVHALERPRFTWGSSGSNGTGDVRQIYLEALRAADRRDFGPLLSFVRS